jgi:hypothetical protein
MGEDWLAEAVPVCGEAATLSILPSKGIGLSLMMDIIHSFQLKPPRRRLQILDGFEASLIL